MPLNSLLTCSVCSSMAGLLSWTVGSLLLLDEISRVVGVDEGGLGIHLAGLDGLAREQLAHLLHHDVHHALEVLGHSGLQVGALLNEGDGLLVTVHADDEDLVTAGLLAGLGGADGGFIPCTEDGGDGALV